MEWSIFHNYRRLVKANKAKPLLCPNCNSELVTQPDKNAEPMLWCMECNNRLIPGLDLYDQIRAVVSEHYA
jgi:RNase P subunit RPR2